jgi:uncharacterized OB-fold protein
MTPEQALVNLKEYYCEEQDHHSYIRESWQTLELAVKNLTAANKPNTPCHHCGYKGLPPTWFFCPDCGGRVPL